MILPRRKFLIGAAATLLAAPAIVRYESLMWVKRIGAYSSFGSASFVFDGSSSYIDGCDAVSDFRITKGVDRYVVDFWLSGDMEVWRYFRGVATDKINNYGKGKSWKIEF